MPSNKTPEQSMAFQARQLRRSRGLTILEILTVCIIIGVLAMIAIPNFIHSKDNAYEASMETNARTLRVMLETYKTDHSLYPDDLRVLGYEATAKKYNKTVSNPYTNAGGGVESGKWALDYTGTTGPAGMVAYQPLAANSKYYIFCYDRNGQLFKRKGQVFTMSNG